MLPDSHPGPAVSASGNRPRKVSHVTRSSRTTRRIAAPLAAALVGGTFATLGLAGPAQAASKTLSGTFDYECAVTAREGDNPPLTLGDHVIGVTATTKVPTAVKRGEKIPARDVAITLAMPELLRQSTTLLLSGVEAEGASTDSAITLTSAGKTQTVKIPRLSAGRTPIPQVAGETWKIPASGTVPAITVPKAASKSVTVGMPSGFTIDATIYRANETQVASHLTCTRQGSGTLGTIAVSNYKPTAKKKITVSTKKGKAKKIKLAALKAKDRDGDSLRYSLAKKPKKKAGTAKIKGKKIVFKPKKKFTGKATFVVKVADGHGGVAKTKVTVKVKKK